MDLCFSEFAKAIQKAIQQPNDDLSVVTLLLEWVTQLPQVVGNNGKPIDIDKSLASKLLNRKVDVPLAIKNECTTQKMVTLAEQHVEKKIIPFFSHVVYENILEELGRLVSEDEIIAKKTKKKLMDYLENEENSKFLGFLLVYVISQPNKLTEERLRIDDIPLLEVSVYLYDTPSIRVCQQRTSLYFYQTVNTSFQFFAILCNIKHMGVTRKYKMYAVLRHLVGYFLIIFEYVFFLQAALVSKMSCCEKLLSLQQPFLVNLIFVVQKLLNLYSYYGSLMKYYNSITVC